MYSILCEGITYYQVNQITEAKRLFDDLKNFYPDYDVICIYDSKYDPLYSKLDMPITFTVFNS